MLSIFLCGYIAIFLIVSLIVYLMFLVLKVISKEQFLRDYIIVNIINIILYIFIYFIKIYIEKIPVNAIGIFDILDVLYKILIVLIMLKLIYKILINKNLKLLRNLIIVLFIWCIIITTDIIFINNNTSPIFARNFNGIITAQDGGTTIYFGLGYKVWEFKKNDFQGFYISSIFESYEEVLEKIYERQKQ